jgi:hypothetical protein
MTRRYNRDHSMSEANSAALYGRDRTYSTAHRMSVTVSQDYRKRQPRDLREAVKMARALYADEVPTKLHEGRNHGTPSLAADGSPKFAPMVTSYIFGSANATDAGHPKCQCPAMAEAFGPPYPPYPAEEASHDHYIHCPAHPSQRPIISYYLFPFRATLDRLSRGGEHERLIAGIVSAVTIGSQGPQQAAIAKGVQPACIAKDVAEWSLRAFLRSMSDVRVEARPEVAA